ncbi:MAG: ectonucleotide pyrophosphatase/phosphodiesterase [Bryobacteraceae bacterium]|jgi:predicted AlkP superfamily pyrophosphatase or phosphodiesterase
MRHLAPGLLILSACCASAVLAGPASSPPAHKLLVLSVDGLDWRYLRDRDQLGLRIPNVRRLLREGRYANGVIGVWPTITWPSHTTLITGVRPDQHGILGNRRPAAQGGEYYWTVDLLKAPTLWQAVHERGWTTASVTWPVTVKASIDFNLPEFFLRRQGGSMDFEGVASKASSNLVDEISTAYPSFPQQWVDDRTRTLAVLYLLRAKRPDLLLVHLVDLDSEAHDRGPFGPNANAVMERTDELIGQILDALPREYDFALVSDHGFERVDKIANPRVLLARSGLAGEIQPMGGIVTTTDAQVAAFLRKAGVDPASGIGREIPHGELVQYAPRLSTVAAAFEPAEHVMLGTAERGDYFTAPSEKGNHGFWPTRRDYRSVFLIFGPDIPTGTEPEMQMIDIAPRLARLLGLRFP